MDSDRFVTMDFVPPTPTPRPTPTPVPTPTPRPTPLPLLGQTQVEALVYQTIASCKLSIDQAYGAPTAVAYNTRYLGQDSWRVKADWPEGRMTYGTWSVDSRIQSVAAFDTLAQTVLNLGSRCGLPVGIKPMEPKPTPTLTTPRPPVFGGTAYLNGVPAPDGTLVTAWIDGTHVASTTVTNGSYAFVIAQLGGTSYSGKLIIFKVGPGIASQIGVWEADGGTELNLFATS